MVQSHNESGLAAINGAHIYYEIAGAGRPLVMIHAGVADSRQWTGEFAHFASRFRVVRYDMRGYGRSEPVEGEYNHLRDLEALLDYLRLDQPAILMGCSMGGSLAMDFVLAHPARAAALVMVCSNPSGLDLDIPDPEDLQEAEKAYHAGDLDRVAEIETRVWFQGMGRTAGQVDPVMRQLAYDMTRLALAHDAKRLGKQVPHGHPLAAERLGELRLPVLVVAGAEDLPYFPAAAAYMQEHIGSARLVTLDGAAHLANLDRPQEFQRTVAAFLDSIGL